MTDRETPTLPRPAVTAFEESVWLLQQQQPDRILFHVAAWPVRPETDLDRLEQAVRSAQRALPDLNARYAFREEGELAKRHDAPPPSAIERHRVSSQADAVALVLARQGMPWDAESQPPFAAMLIEYGGGACLALLLHAVLDELYAPAQIANAIARTFAGDPVPSSRPRPARLPIADAEIDGAAPIDWIRRDDLQPSVTGPYAQMGAEACEVAVPWRMSIISDSSPTAIAAAFACFVAAIGNRPRIDLFLTGPDGIRRIAITRGMNRDAVIEGIWQASATAHSDTPVNPDEATPAIHVHLEPLDGEGAASDTPFGSPLALPTRERHPDLRLTIRAAGSGAYDLDLVTGQPVLPHAGGLLLPRLEHYLRQGDGALATWPGAGTAQVAPQRPREMDRDAVTTIILAEFRQSLSAPDMGPHDDFFDQGGHSLLATRIIGRLLGNHALDVRFGDFFSSPTAAGLSACATPRGADTVDATPKDEGDRIVTAPLALAQGTLWDAYAAMEFGTIFNLPFALDFLDPVDESVLGHAFLDVVERHAGLRTLFDAADGTPRQRVLPPSLLAEHKWFWTSEESQGITLRDEAGHRFDLGLELPLRVRVLRDPDNGRQQLSFLVHHLVIDEWSLNTIMADLGRAYQARSGGGVPCWAGPARGIHEFAERQQAIGVNRDHLRYWTEALAGPRPPLAIFPKDDPTPTHAAGFAASWVDLAIPPAGADGLYASARRNGTSLFTVCYSAIALALHRLGGARTIVLGTSASGRVDPDFLDTVGYFTIMIAHRLYLEPGMTTDALIASAHATITGGMPYADVPIALVQDELGAKGLPFEAYVQIHARNALHGSLPTAGGGLIRYRHIEPDKGESMFDLQFELLENVAEDGTHLRLVITYRAGLYRRGEAERLRDGVERMLSTFAQPQGDARTLDEL